MKKKKSLSILLLLVGAALCSCGQNEKEEISEKDIQNIVQQIEENEEKEPEISNESPLMETLERDKKIIVGTWYAERGNQKYQRVIFTEDTFTQQHYNALRDEYYTTASGTYTLIIEDGKPYFSYRGADDVECGADYSIKNNDGYWEFVSCAIPSEGYPFIKEE